VARAARAKVRQMLPGAHELAYDNYNALALAFIPTEKPSDMVLSPALYPRWVSLFFARGVGLPDPDGLLRPGPSPGGASVPSSSPCPPDSVRDALPR
jgi:hypothetical protein